MEGKEYEFNQIKGDNIVIKNNYKKKGKEYGIAKLTRKHISAFVEALDLISVSPSISSKFSEKLEKFIVPRFMELNNIIYSEKSLPSEISIEFSKENQKDLINSLEFSNVMIGLEERGYSTKELREALKKISFYKEK